MLCILQPAPSNIDDLTAGLARVTSLDVLYSWQRSIQCSVARVITKQQSKARCMLQLGIHIITHRHGGWRTTCDRSMRV